MKQVYISIVVLWSLLRSAQSIFCEPLGLCQETTKSCENDDFQKCFPDNYVRNIKYGYNLSGNKISTTCLRPSHESNNRFDVVTKNLSTKYIHVNPWYVDVCLFWSAESKGNYSNGQYKIRFDIKNQFCVGSNQTSVCIKNVRYTDLMDYTVEVLPNPLAGDDNEVHFKMAQHLSKLTGCKDERIEQKNEICTSRYTKVKNLLVTSSICNNSKTLSVSWDHPDNIIQPEEYFVEVLNSSSNLFFKVTNTTQVLVKNLSASVLYKVNVIAYRRCSGLGDYTFQKHKLGCGKQHGKNEVLLNGSCSQPEIKIPSFSSTMTTAYLLTTAANVKSKSLYFIIGAFLGPMIIIALLTFTAAALIKVLKMRSKQSPVHPIQTGFKVFLFYSPSMVQTRQDLVRGLITTVAKYFSVITIDELMNGDVTQWLERTVNSVDVVLILASKEFLKDWKSTTRCTELYCIESLISAAIVQGTISKFAFVSTENSATDVHIPENSYLKLMRVFLLGTKLNQETELYQFVTKSRGILLEGVGDDFKDAPQIEAKSVVTV